MGMLVGYARVSTQDPSTNLQLAALAKARCVRISSGSLYFWLWYSSRRLCRMNASITSERRNHDSGR